MITCILVVSLLVCQSLFKMSASKKKTMLSERLQIFLSWKMPPRLS
ncbi:hypothetical protein EVA_17339 [gut metagenome]|uniref:Uncharacterized protein n=1 Tax=gut metagenome TaxID=749906 RepID=J9C451_9ZZZZ